MVPRGHTGAFVGNTGVCGRGGGSGGSQEPASGAPWSTLRYRSGLLRTGPPARLDPGAWPSPMCHWAENRHTPWARMDATLSRAHQNAEFRGPPKSTLASPRPAGPVGTGSAIPSRGQCAAGGEVFTVTSLRFLGGKECMTITRQREAGMSRRGADVKVPAHGTALSA